MFAPPLLSFSASHTRGIVFMVFLFLIKINAGRRILPWNAWYFALPCTIRAGVSLFYAQTSTRPAVNFSLPPVLYLLGFCDMINQLK
jgi:hypothetical protein